MFSCIIFVSVLLFNDNEHLNNNNNNHNELQGAIDPDCVVADVVENAYTDAKFLCEQYYLNSPDMHLNVHNGMHLNCKFPCTIIVNPEYMFQHKTLMKWK